MNKTKKVRKEAVELARDVIKQLNSKKIAAHQGSYVRLKEYMGSEEGTKYILPFSDLDSLDFKEEFGKRKELTCNVCVMGALFVSWVNKNDKCNIGEVNDIGHTKLGKHIKEIFSINELEIMERIFENRWVRYPTDISLKTDKKLNEKYNAYYFKYTGEGINESYQPRTGKLLRAIMLNIIRNNGEFKIPKKIVKKKELATV